MGSDTIIEENIDILTEPEEFKKEIEPELEEVKQAIDEVINEKQELDNIEHHFEDINLPMIPESVETTYSNVLKYWARDDSEELSTNYREYQLTSDPSFKSEIRAQEVKDYNTALKTNFNAKARNEFGFSMPGTEETFEEKERNFMFKMMNPALWKFMYDASAYLVFSVK